MRRSARGFTLIELLVAMVAMALLALMSWRGLEGMMQTQAFNRDRADALLTLQTALAQWNADLDATVALSQTRAMDWNGRVLRLTRSADQGATTAAPGEVPAVRVVAWAVLTDTTGAHWRRWQSPPITTRSDWQQAWTTAANWAQGNGGSDGLSSEVVLMPVEGWQLAYYRNDTWSAAVSAEALGPANTVPDGVRLVLNLPSGSALAGALTRDWVRPTMGGQKL